MKFLYLEQQLVDRDYIVDEYTVADIASYLWFSAIAENYPEVLEGTKELRSWLDRVGARPAVKQGMSLRQRAKAA